MQPNLKAYTVNKIISLGLVSVVIGLSWLWFGYGQSQWQFILLMLLTFAYGHFIVGWWYQLRSFFKKDKSWQHFLVFGILAISTILFTEALYTFAGFAVTLFIGFIYFLLHGLFNEQTLLKREGGIHVPIVYICALMIFIFASLSYAVPDPTFLFNQSLQFFEPTPFGIQLFFLNVGLHPQIFTYIFWAGVVASYGVLLVAWRLLPEKKLAFKMGGVISLGLILTLMWGAVPFVYLYFVIMGYHFMTWFLFYLRIMNKRSLSERNQYLLLNFLAILPFLIATWWFFQDETPFVFATIIDLKYLMFGTFLHISTSFMNDEWFQSLQARAFSLFSGKA